MSGHVDTDYRIAKNTVANDRTKALFTRNVLVRCARMESDVRDIDFCRGIGSSVFDVRQKF